MSEEDVDGDDDDYVNLETTRDLQRALSQY